MTDTYKISETLVRSIEVERQHQLDRGFDQKHNACVWLTILMEEVGEFAEAALEQRSEDALDELIQVIAVGVAAFESIAGYGLFGVRED